MVRRKHSRSTQSGWQGASAERGPEAPSGSGVAALNSARVHAGFQEAQSGRGHQDDGQTFDQIFGHFLAFLDPDGPSLALPGSVLTSSTSARPGLDRPTPNNDLFNPVFPRKKCR